MVSTMAIANPTWLETAKVWVQYVGGEEIPNEGMPLATQKLELALEGSLIPGATYEVESVMVHVAEGHRPFGKMEYTSQDIEHGVLDLSKLYAVSDRSPKKGDRVIIEVTMANKVLPNGEVQPVKINTLPRSISLR